MARAADVLPRRTSMDNAMLDAILKDGGERQFWIKPTGLPDRPMAQQPEIWTDSTLEIHFAKKPVRVAVGDILVAFRTGVSKLIYVAECCGPVQEFTEEQKQEKDWRRRWSWFVKAQNLTPVYGA